MLNPDSLITILKSVSDTAKTLFGDNLESVMLFGSYARGDYDDESDVDIMIIADISPEDICSLSPSVRSLCGELLFEFGTVVSVCVQDSTTYHRYMNALPFFSNIAKEGIRVA